MTIINLLLSVAVIELMDKVVFPKIIRRNIWQQLLVSIGGLILSSILGCGTLVFFFGAMLLAQISMELIYSIAMLLPIINAKRKNIK